MKTRYALVQNGEYYHRKLDGYDFNENCYRQDTFASNEEALAEAKQIGLGKSIAFEIREVYFND